MYALVSNISHITENGTAPSPQISSQLTTDILKAHKGYSLVSNHQKQHHPTQCLQQQQVKDISIIFMCI